MRRVRAAPRAHPEIESGPTTESTYPEKSSGLRTDAVPQRVLPTYASIRVPGGRVRWQGVTRPALTTTAPTNRLSNGVPSRREAPRTTTRSLAPATRGGTDGFADVDVGAVLTDGVPACRLLLVQPAAAASAA